MKLDRIICAIFGHRHFSWTHSHCGQRPPFLVTGHCWRCDLFEIKNPEPKPK